MEANNAMCSTCLVSYLEVQLESNIIVGPTTYMFFFQYLTLLMYIPTYSQLSMFIHIQKQERELKECIIKKDTPYLQSRPHDSIPNQLLKPRICHLGHQFSAWFVADFRSLSSIPSSLFMHLLVHHIAR